LEKESGLNHGDTEKILDFTFTSQAHTPEIFDVCLASFFRELFIAFVVSQCLRASVVENVVKGMIPIRDLAHGATFAVKVHPRAKKDVITGEIGDALKLALTAPPIQGRANEACVEFFAKLLKVPRSSVSIAAGQNSRNKVIRVVGLSAEEVRKLLGQ
jgi:uncharacterized protein